MCFCGGSSTSFNIESRVEQQKRNQMPNKQGRLVLYLSLKSAIDRLPLQLLQFSRSSFLRPSHNQ